MRIAEIKVTLSLIVILGLFLTCEKQVFDNVYDPAYKIESPSGLSATPISDTAIRLSWKNNDQERLGFLIERKTTSEFQLYWEVKPHDTVFVDTGLVYGETYTYRVSALAGSNRSAFSNTMSAIMEIPAPTDLTASWGQLNRIELGWTDNSLFELGYRIERKKSESNFNVIAELESDVDTYIDTSVALGTYTYRVTAFTKFYESSRSNLADGWSGRTFSKEYGQYEGYQVVETVDGGYAITGRAGLEGAWHIKTDASGAIQWSQTLGPTYTVGCDIRQTVDGGLVIAGYTNPGNYDGWLIKTDVDGNVEWERTFGGSDFDDFISSVQQTSDGGYILAGHTASFGEGGSDAWLVKTSAQGIETWTYTYGGQDSDEASFVSETLDGGYVIVGATNSLGPNDTDVWIIKTDGSGVLEWEQYLGRGSGNCLQQTKDGGYIITGSLGYYMNVCLIKTDQYGTLEWSKTYDLGEGMSVLQTEDSGFVVSGNDSGDMLILRTNEEGTEVWRRSFGEPGESDNANSIHQTRDEGYVLTGFRNGGNSTMWVIKTDPEGNVYE